MEALLFLFFSFSIAEKETKNLELLLGDCFAPRIALFFMRLLPLVRRKSKLRFTITCKRFTLM